MLKIVVEDAKGNDKLRGKVLNHGILTKLTLQIHELCA